jgi:hypothetical protein
LRLNFLGSHRQSPNSADEKTNEKQVFCPGQ